MMNSDTARGAKLPAKRILVMRYRFIGDTILAVPFLRNLRRAYPDAVIDVLIGPQSGKVLEGCPYVNELIPFDTTDFHKYDRGGGKKRNLLSYAWELRARRYDMIFVLKRSLSSGLLAWLAGARYRVGYDTQGRGFLLTHRVPMRRNVHEVESVLDVLRGANVPIIDKHLEAWPSAEEQEQVYQIAPQLRECGTKILIHAAAAHPEKMYPLEKWAQVLRLLQKRHDAAFYFTGAERDYELYAELERLSGIKAVNLAGKLSMRGSIALLKNMDLAACVDSGPAHLSAAVDTPTIAIFGPTDPLRWGPWGDKHTVVVNQKLTCRPCHYKKTCDDRRECLTELSAEQVADACSLALAKRSMPLASGRR